jgi:hypothetical protein
MKKFSFVSLPALCLPEPALTLTLAAALVFAASIASIAPAARAQMGMRAPATPQGVFNPVVGQGAAYEMTSANGEKRTMEFGIVGKESVDGKEGYWMEISFDSNQMGPMVVKTLTTLDSSNMVTQRVIMQMGSRPPMEMTQMMRGMNNNQPQPADIRNSAEDVGSESITVPAGTFTCEHYRMKDGSGDTWVSSQVTPMGVVKHTGKDSSMILTKVITDAKDKITGTPVEFNPQQMMQQMQQQH